MLALENGYKRICKLYYNCKVVNSAKIDDCVELIRPLIKQE
jgi:hypothetical protein